MALPHVHTHYDVYPEPAVAVEHASPVVHSYTAYPPSCIPAHVPGPNQEAQFPDQARSYGQVPPGQRWARPLPEQDPPAKYRRTSSHQEHPRHRPSLDHAAARTGTLGYDAAPGYGGYHPAYPPQGHAHAPVAYQNYYAPVHAGSHVQHVEPQAHYHPEPHYHPESYHPESYHPEPYRHEPYQYRAEPQVHVDRRYQNAVPASEPTYGLYAPQEHVDQQYVAQNAQFESFQGPSDTQNMLLNTPYKFEDPDDLPDPAQQDFHHQRFESPSYHQHVESPSYHQHVEPQVQFQAYHQHVAPHMNATVAPSQMHTVAPSQVHPNYAHHPGHARRASEFEAPDQVSFQVAHQHDAFVQNHQHPHAHHSAPQAPELEQTSLLQYPTTPVQAHAQVDGQSPESQSTLGEPAQTPERREAIGYQRDLEDRFRKRARQFVAKVGSAFGPEHEQSEQGESESQSSHHYQQHQYQQQVQQQLAPLVPPVVPSQAHERPAPVASSSQAETKKDGPPAPKKPALACLFCRKRKIACGPPPPDSPDRTCNQCMRRKQICDYPAESRRGIRKAPKEAATPVEDQPTVHTFVHDDGSSLGESSKGKATRRKRTHESVD
ncbi:hypothetical protein FRC10_004255 [Ceratobasidium sp. 414]|nr:hypothetical protein FRC10_004255 [Ceratobasidium sp. 414]